MKRQTICSTISVFVLLLVGCKTNPSWDGVILPEPDPKFFSPQLSWVTYERDGELWLSPLPGREEEILIPTGSDDLVTWSTHPRWRSDETGFLLTSLSLSEGTQTLWLVETDDLDERRALCTLPRGELVVRSSPDLTAFLTLEVYLETEGTFKLVRLGENGCQGRPLPGFVAPPEAAPWEISWSPDGQKIAYVNYHTDQLLVADLNTYQVMSIYDGHGLPIWFPDGEAIALIYAPAIPVVCADGSGLVGEIEIPGEYLTELVRNAKWSPDGSRLALALETDYRPWRPTAIGIMDADTLEVSVVEVPEFDFLLGWTPDGSAVIVQDYDDRNMKVLREEKVRP